MSEKSDSMANNRVQGTKGRRNKLKATTTAKEQTGEWSSTPEQKNQDPAIDRNANGTSNKLPGIRTDERRFDLLLDGVPYVVRSIPFLFNDELRFRVMLNDGQEHVLTWDSEVNMLRAIDDESSVLPAGLEEALSEKLQSQMK